MLSLNTSVPRYAGGIGAKRGEVAKNNHNLPMTQTTLMPSTPRSTSSSAHWHPHRPSALVTPRPTPSKESIQSTLDNQDAVTAIERTSTDLDAAHLLASIASQEHLIMTAEEETADGTSGLNNASSSPGLGVDGDNDKTTGKEEEEAPPSPRLTYLCNVVDIEEGCNRDATRSALQDHRGLHVPKFASLQRGMPMMPPPAFAASPPPPPMMTMTMGSSSSPGLDMAFRTRTISVDTADSYLAPDLAYLRNGYESGRLSGVPSTFVSVPTIISPPSSPSSGPRRPMDSSTGTTISSTKRKKKHRDSPKEALVDAFLEDEEGEDDYVDTGADANDDDDEEYLPAAKRRSRKKHKSPRSTSNKAASAVVPSGSSSSRTKSARAARKGVHVSASTLLKNHKGAIQPAKTLKPQCSKGESNPKFRIVLREKFSWKLYPEVSYCYLCGVCANIGDQPTQPNSPTNLFYAYLSPIHSVNRSWRPS